MANKAIATFMGNLTRRSRFDARFKACIVDKRGHAIGNNCMLAIPYSISPYQEFSIGPVRFQSTRNGQIRALDPIPASWLVDLS